LALAALLTLLVVQAAQVEVVPQVIMLAAAAEQEEAAQAMVLMAETQGPLALPLAVAVVGELVVLVAMAWVLLMGPVALLVPQPQRQAPLQLLKTHTGFPRAVQQILTLALQEQQGLRVFRMAA